MQLDEITPLILTYNEEANLRRALAAISWAKQIFVIDSGSTDGTAGIAAEFSNVKLITRSFDNHTAQWNFGLDQVRSPWVLTLDADYVCPHALLAELRNLTPILNAYQARFHYCIQGRPLRGSLYPARVVLFRAAQFRYRPDGHTQLLHVPEPLGELNTVLLHDDRKPISRWLNVQSHYADLEVAKLSAAESRSLDWKDRLRRRIFWMPILTAVYCLVYKRLILDGWPGIYYSFQRVYAELLLSMKLLDLKLRGQQPLEEANVATQHPAISQQDCCELTTLTE